MVTTLNAVQGYTHIPWGKLGDTSKPDSTNMWVDQYSLPNLWAILYIYNNHSNTTQVLPEEVTNDIYGVANSLQTIN